MMDPEVTNLIIEIKEHIDKVNALLEAGWNSGLEVRINYVDKTSSAPPRLDLWKATQSIDYLVEVSRYTYSSGEKQ